jgi:hypothetical protein
MNLTDMSGAKLRELLGIETQKPRKGQLKYRLVKTPAGRWRVNIDPPKRLKMVRPNFHLTTVDTEEQAHAVGERAVKVLLELAARD